MIELHFFFFENEQSVYRTCVRLVNTSACLLRLGSSLASSKQACTLQRSTWGSRVEFMALENIPTLPGIR